MSSTPKPVGRESPYRQQRPSTVGARKAPRRSSLGVSLSSPRVPPPLSSPRPEPHASEHAEAEREPTGGGDNPRRGRASYIPSPRPRTAPPRRSSFGSSAPPPSQPPPPADGALRRAPCAKRQPQPRPRQPTAAATPTQHAHRERPPQPSPRQSLPAPKRTLPARPEAALAQPAAAPARRPADHEFETQLRRKLPVAAAAGATAAAVQPGSSLPFFRFSLSAPPDAPAQSLSPPPAARPPPVELMASPPPLASPAAPLTPPAASPTPPAASPTPPAASLTPPPKAFSPAGMQRQGSSLEVGVLPCYHPAPLLPPCTLNTTPPPLARVFTTGSAPGYPAPTPRASSRLPSPNPSCSDRVSLPSSDLAFMEADGLYLGCNLGSRLRPHASRLQPYVARWTPSSSTRPSLSPTPPIAPSGHGLPTPRDRRIRRASRRTVRAALAALVFEAATSGIQTATSYMCMHEAATLCLPGLEGEGEGRGENSAPPPAAAAEVEAPCQEVRRGRAGWHCCAPLHAHHTRTKRAPSAHPKHTTVRYRTTTAPHRYRCATGALAGRACRSLTGGTRHF